jgi:hypothetical protein
MFNLREVIKMSIEKMVKENNFNITKEEKINLIENIAYQHAQKYNYCYMRQMFNI